MSLTKRFICNDVGMYYVREVGSRVFWFGESRQNPRRLGQEWDSRRFANVFMGERRGNEITGDWFDVPKGNTRSQGRLRLRIADEDRTITRIERSGGFGGSSWRSSRSSRESSRFHNPGFQSESADDLTGTWMGNDGGVYYVRQVGNKIVWFGEKGRLWSNVYVGTLEGENIQGNWADVPKGCTSGSGTLTLRRTNHYTLDRTAATGGFGGTQWHRVHCVGVDVSLEQLFIHSTEDELDGDEPYLWTIYFKIDGDTVSLTDLRNASATVISNSRSHGNLTPQKNLSSGTILPIPENVGRFSTVLKTIRPIDPLSSLARENTKFGFIVIAWEEDGLSDAAIEAGRRAFVSTLQRELDNSIRRLREPNIEELEGSLKDAVEAAIRAEGIDFVHLILNDGFDDTIGQYVFNLNFTELNTRNSIPLNLNFTHGAHYNMQGMISTM